MFDIQIHAARRARVFEAHGARGRGRHAAARRRREAPERRQPVPLPPGLRLRLGRSGSTSRLARRCSSPPAEGERKLVLFVRPKDREKEILGRHPRRRGGCGGDLRGRRRLPGGRDGGEAGGAPGRRAPRSGTGSASPGVGRAAWCGSSGAAGPQRASGKRPPERGGGPGRILHELRLVKAPEELAQLRRAAEITAEAHMAAMRDGRPGGASTRCRRRSSTPSAAAAGTGPATGPSWPPGPTPPCSTTGPATPSSRPATSAWSTPGASTASTPPT